MNLLRVAVAAFCSTACLMFSTAQAAVVPIIDPDTSKLIGAKNIEVFGETYDVLFVTGSCAEAFDGCDEASDFIFTTLPFFVDVTFRAMEALLDAVFIDSPLGSFDTDINLTFGCSSSVSNFCNFFAPYELLSDGSPGVIATSNSNLDDDGVAPSFGALTGPPVFTLGDNQLWAVFSPSPPVGEIPLPAAAPMFVAGLLSIGAGLARRRKSAVN